MRKLLSVVLVLAFPGFLFAAETPPATEQPTKPVPPVTAAPPATTAESPKPAATVRVGYVDMAKAGAESELGKASRVKAQEKQKKLQAQIESKRKQLDKQKAALEAKFATLTPAQRESKAKEFQKKVEEFQKFGLNAEKELQTLQDDLTSEVFKAIEQTAVEYGKANGLALVVVKRELLYVGGGVQAEDITDGILKLLNQSHGKK